MMYIMTEDGKEHKWHIGKKSPISYYHVSLVVEVQADGDELEKIIAFTDNLPKAPSKSVGRWFGDHAKFIVCNVVM